MTGGEKWWVEGFGKEEKKKREKNSREFQTLFASLPNIITQWFVPFLFSLSYKPQRHAPKLCTLRLTTPSSIVGFDLCNFIPMAGCKFLKRKGGVDQISDDFSDFSLSSPATKIRRLDGGALPPIVEEEEPVTFPLTPSANEERALVLFKPIHHSPSSFSLTLDSDLISEIKNQQLPWSKQCDYERLIGSHEEEQDNNNRRLAIVPWVPQQQPSPSTHFDDSADNNNNTELMEADEMGGEGEGVASMMMDVEQEDTATVNNSSASTFHYPTMLNDLHQGPVPEGFQHQQHCLLPLLPQNTSTPITWTR